MSQHHRRLSLRRDPLSGRGRTHRSCVVSLHGLPAPRRRADGRLVDVRGGCAQGDEGDAQGLRVLGTWPAAVLRRLRHGPVLHQCECACPASSIFRARPTTIPMPFRPWCISRPPSGFAGWSARTNCRPSSAIRRRHSGARIHRADERSDNPPTALPGNSENAAPIVSFVGEYSAHLPVEDLPRVHAIGILKHGFSHPGESRRAAIRFCDAIPNWVR